MAWLTSRSAVAADRSEPTQPDQATRDRDGANNRL